jgi:hypothetical protein
MLLLHVQHRAVLAAAVAAGGAAGSGSGRCTAVQSSAVNPVQWVQGRQMHCKPVGNGKRQGHHDNTICCLHAHRTAALRACVQDDSALHGIGARRLSAV